jgi:hypothetical protein
MNMNVIEFVLSNGFSTDRELLGSPTVSIGGSRPQRRSKSGPHRGDKRSDGPLCLFRCVPSRSRIVVAAISIAGFALCAASAALKADRDIVLAAVRQTGIALYFAAEELKDDFEIALAACENQGCAIEFVSQRLKDDGRIRAAAEAEHAALIEKCGGFENLGRHGRTEEEREREIFARDFANGLPFEQWGASAVDDVVASSSEADY